MGHVVAEVAYLVRSVADIWADQPLVVEFVDLADERSGCDVLVFGGRLDDRARQDDSCPVGIAGLSASVCLAGGVCDRCGYVREDFDRDNARGLGEPVLLLLPGEPSKRVLIARKPAGLGDTGCLAVVAAEAAHHLNADDPLLGNGG